ncbi:maleylacetoacetate isomerase [Bdellovibrio bacteriovorus]|uniref:maleylacetoacetate isomerase n=1 Tax=Bdellovibrio bacteriovorus TaxID=959 RepID=UPI0021CE1CA3|nr:maleylacetoacetate isomerase [Bdellovibrio bacteriovorus]UXR65475.1 maleylacetoacetate isomerase [Bdellovibrio bacteriovorus]
MASMVLYNYFRSSTSYRVRLALHYKELQFEYKPINLLKGEQLSADYKKINPLGGVPTLVHNGKIIPESFAIMEYLDEVFPEKPLFPNDAYTKARIRQVCEVINSFMHPMANLKTLKYMEAKHGYDQNQKDEWAQHWVKQGLEVLETTLKEFSGTYSFGNEITMADLFLIPQLLTSQRYKVDISQYPTLVKINENCLKLESFQKAHPFAQIDTPEEFKKK